MIFQSSHFHLSAGERQSRGYGLTLCYRTVEAGCEHNGVDVADAGRHSDCGGSRTDQLVELRCGLAGIQDDEERGLVRRFDGCLNARAVTSCSPPSSEPSSKTEPGRSHDLRSGRWRPERRQGVDYVPCGGGTRCSMMTCSRCVEA